MRILITTGLSGDDVGGPTQYAPNLAREFSDMGHPTKIISYGSVERFLPPLIRHVYFLLRIIPSVVWADKLITLDTFSVGVPSVFAAKLLNKKILVRIGGDFLWEAYVNRTGDLITLPDFYKQLPSINTKERIILRLTRWLLKTSEVLVFNTDWFREIWLETFNISKKRTQVVFHPIIKKRTSSKPLNKNFLWAGRENKVKNVELLKWVATGVVNKNPAFSLDLFSNKTHEEVLEKIKNSYAVILPSLSDTCPLFIIEALSFGKPFIMTQETGLREIYDKGGIFINPKDEDDLEKAIEKMLDPICYDKYLQEARSFNKERSWELVSREFLDICKTI